MRWTHTPVPTEEIEALSKGAGVSRVLAELLLRAGLRDAGGCATFLAPALAALQDPFLLRNVDAAATRLRQAIANQESVVVLGDYDVDGVSSTALLVSVLRRFGLLPRFVVPRRSEDGYGLSRSAIDRALEGGRPHLFVVLDCGTNSHDEVAYLREQGIDVIVLDHHRSKERALDGMLINPHVHRDDTGADGPWRHLCTVGLVFKLAHGLLKQLRAENHPVAFRIKLRDHLDLVALGTVADLVPLLGENRILARHGLTILQESRRPGLRALMEVAGVKPENGINPVDISFRLGPRINASGRLADAALSVELLLSEDLAFCQQTAQQLDAFNRERQEIERKITEEAEQLIETHYADSPGIVLFSEDWHPGVVGIVAGRVTRKYNRPCVVLGNEGEFAKGSGRSIDGLNLVEVLGTCCDHLVSWGGHPMAVGIALRKEHLPVFREQFAAAVRTQAGDAIAEARLELAAWLTPEQITPRLMDELEQLHPFGQGNAEPRFGVRGVVLRTAPEIFKTFHFRFNFEDQRGRRLHGVAWKMASRLLPVGVPVDLAVELKWNHFNDRKFLQLCLVDWRPSAG
ncbi:single-stranded-DNA-specific exonuclease RecJ [Opitutus terrae]|uniref:Single-stranded-DNA-specific exonuclease RecJ n=1 Tax=Opitutus terrae (strain DSM 11246 / JCM 15787 / PB90-1) TaxID=452637 RepID=B1ZV73_OPITP|nr:single-stranded-DNA-specific exonuclease RecJ [Opitutus terrae]ACB76740.1 single-stranded-DNA-specific exonuclease RecJ [Opitutus terrae PB90-1]